MADFFNRIDRKQSFLDVRFWPRLCK